MRGEKDYRGFSLTLLHCWQGRKKVPRKSLFHCLFLWVNTENPSYKEPMLIGHLLKFPRYKVLCQYIRLSSSNATTRRDI